MRMSKKRYRWICVGNQQANNEEEAGCWKADKNVTMQHHWDLCMDIILECRASRTRPDVMVNLVKLIVLLSPNIVLNIILVFLHEINT